MLRSSFFLLAFLAGSLQVFEPARFANGEVVGIPYRSQAAGLVAMEVSVNAQGGVTDSRTLESVDPFTNVMKESVSNWRFIPARDNRVRIESRVLVMGFFRPAMLLPAAPKGFKAAGAEASEDVPFPLTVEVPPYPPNASGSAYVVLELEVAENGSVASTRVCSPQTGFDQAALDAARNWQFRPARRNSNPTSSKAVLVVAFREPVH